MLPGPKEPDADQLQEYQRLIVDDLVKLFEDGIRVPTPSSPAGMQSCTASFIFLINLIVRAPRASDIARHHL